MDTSGNAASADSSLYPSELLGLDGLAEAEQISLDVCFQVGLRLVSEGFTMDAARVWARLDALDADHYMYLTKEGLLAIFADDYERAAYLLYRAILRNRVDLALSRQLRRIAASLPRERVLDSGSAVSA